jgi:hypothetical protein
VRGTSGELSIALQVGVVGFRRRGSGLASDRAGAFERRRRRRYQAAGGWRLAANTSERVFWLQLVWASLWGWVFDA